VSNFDAETLARQLAQLGRDLQDEVKYLGELEEAAVDAEGVYRSKETSLEWAQDKAFLDFDGSVEVRKAQSRQTTLSYQMESREAYLEWGKAKGRLRTQQANLSALHKRVEIGRSLLSREKALLSLSGIGEV
jgi:hypothetical protein